MRRENKEEVEMKSACIMLLVLLFGITLGLGITTALFTSGGGKEVYSVNIVTEGGVIQIMDPNNSAGTPAIMGFNSETGTGEIIPLKGLMDLRRRLNSEGDLPAE